ncbi:MAG TPA: hypothetical protein PKJ62_04510 [Bacteroidia bacterium]|nr:hypothetical protein [Bacteroidia bacterium]HNS11371.1 hypothetical protein [Bacteroidia bacterium]
MSLFMKYILIILLIIVILGWLRRVLFFGAARALRKAAEDMAKQQAQHHSQRTPRKPEGSVTVEDLSKRKGRSAQPAEYTDYEEVD